jgi:hypothetical protein
MSISHELVRRADRVRRRDLDWRRVRHELATAGFEGTSQFAAP